MGDHMNNAENIPERFKKLATEMGIPDRTYSLDETFEFMGNDSLDDVELVMAVEEEFGIEISDEDADKIKTPAQAIAYLESKLK